MGIGVRVSGYTANCRLRETWRGVREGRKNGWRTQRRKKIKGATGGRGRRGRDGANGEGKENERNRQGEEKMAEDRRDPRRGKNSWKQSERKRKVGRKREKNLK